GTESEADANLAGALLDAVGDDCVQAGGGEEQRGAGKGTDEQQTESTCRKCGSGNFIHRSNRADGDVRIDGPDLGADRWFESGRGGFQNPISAEAQPGDALFGNLADREINVGFRR